LRTVLPLEAASLRGDEGVLTVRIVASSNCSPAWFCRKTNMRRLRTGCRLPKRMSRSKSH